MLWTETSSLSPKAPQKGFHPSQRLLGPGTLVSLSGVGCCLRLSRYSGFCSNQIPSSRGNAKVLSLHGSPVPPGNSSVWGSRLRITQLRGNRVPHEVWMSPEIPLSPPSEASFAFQLCLSGTIDT